MRKYDGHPIETSELMADCVIDEYFGVVAYALRQGPVILTRFQLFELVQKAYEAGVDDTVEYQEEKQ